MEVVNFLIKKHLSHLKTYSSHDIFPREKKYLYQRIWIRFGECLSRDFIQSSRFHLRGNSSLLCKLNDCVSLWVYICNYLLEYATFYAIIHYRDIMVLVLNIRNIIVSTFLSTCATSRWRSQDSRLDVTKKQYCYSND